MDTIYESIYCGFGLIILIMQIVLNSSLDSRPNGRTKIWNILLGFSVVAVIFDIVYICIMTTKAGVGGLGTRTVLFIAIFFVAHIIVLASTFVKKAKYKPEIIKYNKTFIITTLIMIIFSGILVATPRICEKLKNYNQIYASELQFLTKKYGDQNFEAIGDGDVTSPTDRPFGSPRLIYHYVTILEPTSGAKFRVHDSTDNFVERYYSALLNKYLKKYNVSTSIDLTTNNMPNNLGRIPTLDELSKEMGKYDYIVLNMYDFNYNDKDSELSILKELSYDLATCLVREFKIEKDTKLRFEICDMYRKIRYYINIQDYSLVITDSKKNPLASLDLSTIE